MRRVLYGRAAEQAAIDRLVEGARDGAGGALVLRGEPGIGRSAILDDAATRAGGVRLLRGAGIESESGLPYAGLQLLLAEHREPPAGLPASQAAALRAALDLEPGDDRALVGPALAALLAEVAGDAGLLCLIDDAQWLDAATAEALRFAARRAGRSRVAIVLAVRGDPPAWEDTGLPELRAAGLDPVAARGLLAERAPDLPPEHRDRVIQWAEGNPLALVELPATLPGQDAGAAMCPAGVLPADGRGHRAFRDRVGALPEPTRVLLTLLAADDTGAPAMIAQAARLLGVSLDALEPAERAGLVRLGRSGFGFRHPLVRVAAYQGASVTGRMAAQRALADVFGRAGDSERRAWHLAVGAVEADETIADELERAAGRARERGGPSAAAFAYQRAAQLSSAAEARGRRLLAAAESALAAGRPGRARGLAESAARTTGDPAVRAGADLVRAATEEVPGAAARILLDRATCSADPAISARLLGEAGLHAWHAGDGGALDEAAGRLRELGRPADRAWGYYAFAARALAAVLGDDERTAQRLLRRAVQAPCDEASPMGIQLYKIDAAVLTGNDEAAADLSAAMVARCRERGEFAALPHALRNLALARLWLGAYDDVRKLAAEAVELAGAAGQHDQIARLKALRARLAAVAGDEKRCRALAGEALAATGSPSAQAGAGAALGLLDLGLGRPEDALERFAEVLGGPASRTFITAFVLQDHVEAAAAAGRPEAAKESMDRLAAWAEYSERPWARGVAERCRALLAPDDRAEGHFISAVEWHRRGGGRPFERARTELLFGEWLRRARHRARARAHLRSALEIFERLDARPWAERAHRELRAAGSATVTVTDDDPLARLTAQEVQVVRLAATGATNREIGARLYLSHRTVGYHLYKAFPKLGVGSRADLPRLGLVGRDTA